MNASRIPTVAPTTPRAVEAGSMAAALSAATLAWRGLAESRALVAPINATSHIVWGDEALHADRADLRHTALGAGIHWASAVLWGGLYAALRRRRALPTAGNALADAATVAAVAAVVDLKLVPQRLTPGFERRLSTAGLVLVYAAFGVGLALAGLQHAPQGLGGRR